MKQIIAIVALCFFIGCSQNHNTTVPNSTANSDSSAALQLIKGPAYLTSLQFKNDYPTHETENKLYDAIDFQRACQAYIGTMTTVLEEGQATPPRGFQYWQKLSDIINKNGVHDDKKIFIAMLKSLGIEAGKPFNPSLHQKIILTEAAEIGFHMAQAIAFGRIYDSAFAYGSTHWKQEYKAVKKGNLIDAELDQQTIQAMTISPVVNDSLQKNPASEFLASRKDKEGEWLDGTKFYQLHIPANIPAASWTLTVFDNSTNQVIKNEEPRSSFNSRKPTYLANGDGSVDVFFGSIAPAGEGTNWIRTLPNKGWFAYLALSNTSKDFIDQKWKLNDIERVDEKTWKGSHK
jgi:hypothetical protein